MIESEPSPSVGDAPTVAVAICTHSPRLALLERVIDAIAAQTVNPERFSVVVVDNASLPPLSDAVVLPLTAAGISASLVLEPVAGLTRARLRAIRETTSDWLLFVDDDNVLAPSFLAEALDFVSHHPEVGCVGGKLLLPHDLRCPRWARPYLPFLGIKDLGDEPQSGISSEWQPWEPPGAGLFCRREILARFAEKAGENDETFALGRTGASNLASCDDALLTSLASVLGMATAYHPRMVLYHHIGNQRLKLAYLLRLMAAYGRSHVALARIRHGQVDVPAYYGSLPALMGTLGYSFAKNLRKSLGFAIGMMVYHFAGWRAYRSEAS
jgi:glycosyltransferase involved in cell wall biosynthesis